MATPHGALLSPELPAELAAALAELDTQRAALAKASHDLYDDPPWLGAIIAAVATVVDVVTRVGSKVADIAGVLQVVSAILFHSKELRGVLERLNPAVANYLGEHFGNWSTTLANLGDGVLNDLAQQTLEGHDVVAQATELASLKRAAADIATRAPKVKADIDAHTGLMGELAERGEAILRGAVEGMLGLYTKELQERRGELPENVNQVAAGLVSTALKFGLGAQVAALVVEAVYFTKHTGLNQLVGYMADFAGFSRITEPLIGPQLKYGLAIPAEHQAAKLYRTRIASSREVREQAFQRHVTPEDYARSLRLEGFPEDWIAVLVADLYVDPRPREIITLTEGLDVDPVWLAEKYRENGWDDVDVARAVEATVRRVRQPAAERYARTIGVSYLTGYRPLDQVRRALRNVSRDETYLDLWTKSLLEERNHRNAEALATAVLDQYRNDVIGPLIADEMLESLGYEAPERRRRLALTALKREQRLLTEDTADIEALARSLRSQALTTLRGELRGGRLTYQEFVTLGRMVGYDEQWLGAIGDLEETKAPARELTPLATVGLERLAAQIETLGEIPTDDKGKPLPGWEGLQSAALVNLRAHLRAGTLSRDDFIALGQMLGLNPLTLDQMADVELLRAKVPAEVIDNADAEELAEAAHAALLDLAGDLVARQVIAGARALTLLHEAGVPTTPAEIVIGIAEILGRRAERAVGWPFENMDPRQMIWTTVLEAVLGVVRGGGQGRGLLDGILSLVGGGDSSPEGLRGLLDGLTSIFSPRPGRSRVQQSVERPGAPPNIPPADNDMRPRTADEMLRHTLERELIQLQARLLACQEDQRQRGQDPEVVPVEISTIDDATPTAELENIRQHFEDMLARCRGSQQGHPHPQPQPPAEGGGGGAHPGGPPEPGNEPPETPTSPRPRP